MGIKFGSWVPNCHLKRIDRFKFGGSVQDHHVYICEKEILADFNLVVAQAVRQTAKFNSPPNFPAIWHIIYMHNYLNLYTVGSRLSGHAQVRQMHCKLHVYIISFHTSSIKSWGRYRYMYMQVKPNIHHAGGRRG